MPQETTNLFMKKNLSCTCPADKPLSFRGQRTDKNNNIKVFLKDDFYSVETTH